MLVNGPIASGKSTLAWAIAQRLHADGRTVAVVDMDDVADMVPNGVSGPGWRWAHQVHGALVAGWLETDIDHVVAHGSAFTPDDMAALVRHLPPGTRLHHVLLRCSYVTALRRVTAQAERGLSKDPDFLRRAYDRFEQLLPSIEPSDQEFDSERHQPGELADRIVAVLGAADDRPR